MPARSITNIPPAVHHQPKQPSNAPQSNLGVQVVSLCHVFSVTNITGNACKETAGQHGKGYSDKKDSHLLEKQRQATKVHMKTKDFHSDQSTMEVPMLTKELKHQMLKKYNKLKADLEAAQKAHKCNAGKVSSLTQSVRVAKQKLIDNGIKLPKI